MTDQCWRIEWKDGKPKRLWLKTDADTWSDETSEARLALVRQAFAAGEAEGRAARDAEIRVALVTRRDKYLRHSEAWDAIDKVQLALGLAALTTAPSRAEEEQK